MSPDRIVPVPDAIARRAWECAWVLATEFLDMVPEDERERLIWIANCKPDWGWHAVGEMFRLHRQIVGTRV